MSDRPERDDRPESQTVDGVCQLRAPGTRWLVTGLDGGYRDADAAYNVSVPAAFDRTELAAYATERRERAGFGPSGPTLLTGVDIAHARGAHGGSVTVVATAGVSNPAALPVGESAGGDDGADDGVPEVHDRTEGTVNLLVRTDRALADGALATLLGVVVEAKAATLLARTGFPGTTTDAVVVGCDPGGENADFAGSATPVGAAARACVREAVTASLDARYARTDAPTTVPRADHGVATTRRATVFEP